MNTELLKLGKYSEQKIVDTFGTNAQKKSFQEKGKLTGSYKTKLLETAARYCKITELPNRYYVISEIYKYPIPKQFTQMNRSLYKYITPLLLYHLINGHDADNAITLTVGKWAREIKMINHNYTLIKNNKEQTHEEYGLDVDLMYEFYDKSDTAIESYIINALNYLKAATCIIWNEVYYVVEEVTDNNTVIDEDGVISTFIHLNEHVASKEEKSFYAQCIKYADEQLGITNASERYYSQKSQEWNRLLKRKLYERKYKLFYKAYEAYYVNLDKCQALLNLFDEKNQDILYNMLSTQFTSYILTNAENRLLKNPGKYKRYDDMQFTYCEQFENLCDMVINPQTEYLGNKIEMKNPIKYTLRIKENQ